jgi:hypothetical protein
VAVALAAGAAALPTVLELRKISAAMSQYRLEAAVHDRTMANSPRPSAAAFLDPPFMKKYGLSSEAYLDRDGYFSPNGHHWAKWPLETRVVAILMFADKSFPTAWRIRQASRQIDEYYARSNRSTPLVNVVQAVATR